MAREKVSVDPQLQAIRQAGRLINPYRQDEIGRRLRISGTYNLCVQMIDPSVDTIALNFERMMALPEKRLQDLVDTMTGAGYESDWYLEQCGNGEVNLADFARGARNAEELARIARSKSWDSSDEVIDPMEIAESFKKQIAVSNEASRLGEAASLIGEELDLKQRYQMALSLRDRVSNFLTNRPTDGDDRREIGYYLERASEYSEAAIRRHQLEDKIKLLLTKDKERFEEMRKQFGAKGANLVLLAELLEIMEAMGIGNDFFGVTARIPEFKLGPTSLYHAWKENRLSDDDLLPYFDFARNLVDRNGDRVPCIVRSSAVHSEDGDDLTGAGIYESVEVPENATFKQFEKALIKVFRSVDSEGAIEYRRENAIETEEMGFIVQRYVYDGKSGHINTQLAGIPELMEIVTMYSRNFINRDRLNFLLGMGSYAHKILFNSIHHFPPDINKANPEHLAEISQYALIIERLWGRPVQMEFVGYNFVQVRELPRNALVRAETVEFPNEKPIHAGSAVGAGDMVLDVLDDYDYNADKKGVVVIECDEKFTITSTSRLPREGAVIVTLDWGASGHIETLCAERGLVCIFPSADRRTRTMLPYRLFFDHKKLRVVANGMEGRVYKVEENVLPK